MNLSSLTNTEIKQKPKQDHIRHSEKHVKIAFSIYQGFWAHCNCHSNTTLLSVFW